MYTAVVLDSESVSKLKQTFQLPDGWTVKVPPHDGQHGRRGVQEVRHAALIGQTVEVNVVSLAQGQLVWAVGVEMLKVPSVSAQKHITLGCERGGEVAKAKMSNFDLTELEAGHATGSTRHCGRGELAAPLPPLEVIGFFVVLRGFPSGRTPEPCPPCEDTAGTGFLVWLRAEAEAFTA
jgi:hypothetical protein